MLNNITICGNPAIIHENKGQKRQKIKVNEIFGPTIQGEGKSVGKEVMFLRTSFCNLRCIWCDTPYTWNFKETKFKHPIKYNKNDEVTEMSNDNILKKLRELGESIKSLVISGGEPLLQQNSLARLCSTLKIDNYWIEVETNGTIEPSDEIIQLIDQFNCSPKLSNSGLENKLEMREKPKALQKLASLEKTTFKFVISNRSDIFEILDLVKKYQMKNIYLMAEGITKEEQEEKESFVKEICQQYGFNFTPRLHILKWGQKRGV